MQTLSLINGGHDQGTSVWKQARAGCATASRFADILAFKKDGKETAARRDYRLQLVVERLTGIPHEGFRSAAMEWGTQTEAQARARYEMATGNLVEEVGFQPHPEIEWCGVSPDGLVGDDGMIEIKCPNPETHLRTVLMRNEALAQVLLGEKTAAPTALMPEEYYPQVQGNLWALNRQWCDFVSYDPRFPDAIQLYVQRVHRDEKFIADLEAGIRKFLAEVEDCVTQILGVNANNLEAINDGISQ